MGVLCAAHLYSAILAGVIWNRDVFPALQTMAEDGAALRSGFTYDPERNHGEGWFWKEGKGKSMLGRRTWKCRYVTVSTGARHPPCPIL